MHKIRAGVSPVHSQLTPATPFYEHWHLGVASVPSTGVHKRELHRYGWLLRSHVLLPFCKIQVTSEKCT